MKRPNSHQQKLLSPPSSQCFQCFQLRSGTDHHQTHTSRSCCLLPHLSASRCGQEQITTKLTPAEAAASSFISVLPDAVRNRSPLNSHQQKLLPPPSSQCFQVRASRCGQEQITTKLTPAEAAVTSFISVLPGAVRNRSPLNSHQQKLLPPPSSQCFQVRSGTDHHQTHTSRSCCLLPHLSASRCGQEQITTKLTPAEAAVTSFISVLPGAVRNRSPLNSHQQKLLPPPSSQCFQVRASRCGQEQITTKLTPAEAAVTSFISVLPGAVRNRSPLNSHQQKLLPPPSSQCFQEQITTKLTPAEAAASSLISVLPGAVRNRSPLNSHQQKLLPPPSSQCFQVRSGTDHHQTHTSRSCCLLPHLSASRCGQEQITTKLTPAEAAASSFISVLPGAVRNRSPPNSHQQKLLPPPSSQCFQVRSGTDHHQTHTSRSCCLLLHLSASRCGQEQITTKLTPAEAAVTSFISELPGAVRNRSPPNSHQQKLLSPPSSQCFQVRSGTDHHQTHTSRSCCHLLHLRASRCGQEQITTKLTPAEAAATSFISVLPGAVRNRSPPNSHQQKLLSPPSSQSFQLRSGTDHHQTHTSRSCCHLLHLRASSCGQEQITTKLTPAEAAVTSFISVLPGAVRNRSPPNSHQQKLLSPPSSQCFQVRSGTDHHQTHTSRSCCHLLHLSASRCGPEQITTKLTPAEAAASSFISVLPGAVRNRSPPNSHQQKLLPPPSSQCFQVRSGTDHHQTHTSRSCCHLLHLSASRCGQEQITTKLTPAEAAVTSFISVLPGAVRNRSPLNSHQQKLLPPPSSQSFQVRSGTDHHQTHTSRSCCHLLHLSASRCGQEQITTKLTPAEAAATSFISVLPGAVRNRSPPNSHQQKLLPPPSSQCFQVRSGTDHHQTHTSRSCCHLLHLRASRCGQEQISTKLTPAEAAVTSFISVLPGAVRNRSPPNSHQQKLLPPPSSQSFQVRSGTDHHQTHTCRSCCHLLHLSASRCGQEQITTKLTPAEAAVTSFISELPAAVRNRSPPNSHQQKLLSPPSSQSFQLRSGTDHHQTHTSRSCCHLLHLSASRCGQEQITTKLTPAEAAVTSFISVLPGAVRNRSPPNSHQQKLLPPPSSQCFQVRSGTDHHQTHTSRSCCHLLHLSASRCGPEQITTKLTPAEAAASSFISVLPGAVRNRSPPNSHQQKLLPPPSSQCFQVRSGTDHHQTHTSRSCCHLLHLSASRCGQEQITTKLTPAEAAVTSFISVLPGAVRNRSPPNSHQQKLLSPPSSQCFQVRSGTDHHQTHTSRSCCLLLHLSASRCGQEQITTKLTPAEAAASSFISVLPDAVRNRSPPNSHQQKLLPPPSSQCFQVRSGTDHHQTPWWTHS
ncbi:unnamed protein product [Leuciscus chuanchicus]